MDKIQERLTQHESRISKLESASHFMATKQDVEKVDGQIAGIRYLQLGVFLIVAADIILHWLKIVP